MEDNLKSKKYNISAILKAKVTKSNEDNVPWKTVSDGRKPTIEDALHWKMTSNGRVP